MHCRLEKREGIFIRTYKSRPQLLRAVVVGAKGTPYQDGLYFFDVHLRCTYPDRYGPLTLRFHSAGFQIHPDIYRCGEVSLTEFTAANLYLKKQGHYTFKILQLLVIIKDVLLNKNPLYHHDVYRGSPISPILEQKSVLYNECVIIKSLKIMVYIMNKPPKYFEAFVVGHFRRHARDILMACEGYINGRFLNGELEKRCSIAFKKEVVSCIKPLIYAFIRIGSLEAYSFLRLSENTITVGSPERPVVTDTVDDEFPQPNETENEEGPSESPSKRQCIMNVGIDSSDSEGTGPLLARAQDKVMGHQVDLHTIAVRLDEMQSSLQFLLSQFSVFMDGYQKSVCLERMAQRESQSARTALVGYDQSRIDIAEDAQGNQTRGVGAAVAADIARAGDDAGDDAHDDVDIGIYKT